MALTLPNFVVIRSVNNGRFLSFTIEPEALHGHVTAREQSVFDPFVKIAVEKAKNHTNFVHFRFCHTNKYWARGPHFSNTNQIIASSNQPEEDTSRMSCTLFEPIPQNDGSFGIRHVQSNGHLFRGANEFSSISILGSMTNSVQFRFTFVDWDTLVILPNHVTFKGDNDRYLRAIQGTEHLEFSSDDGTEEATAYEITMNPDGHIRIKSLFTDKFWRRGNIWVLADSTDTTGTNRDTLFWPVKLVDNTIALRSASNNRFCRRFTNSGRTNALNADNVTISNASRLQVEELVLERSIFNVRFRMEQARVYNEKASIVGFGSAINESEKPTELTVSIGYDDTSSHSFSNGSSITSGVTTSISTGIPRIMSGSIEISNERTTSFEWSKTVEQTRRADSQYVVAVPPRSWVRVTFVATEGTCSVPFSYTQRDKAARDGTFSNTERVDGIYHGVNYYSFHFEKHDIQPL